MSVDYESVLIYGYRISADEVERVKKNIGRDAWDILREKYDGSDHYELVRENSYHGLSDYYFGITLGSELELDSIDSLCWFEWENDMIVDEFEKIFGSIYCADLTKPMMYHFVRVY